MLRIHGVVLGVTFAGVACIPVSANSLDYWDFNVEQSRLEIITENGVRPQAQMMANPTRLIVDLPGVQSRSPLMRQAGVSAYVREIRVGQFTRLTTRIVVELTAPYSMRPWEVKVRSLAPNRWFVQLAKFQPHHIYSLPPQEGSVAIAVPFSRSTNASGRYTAVIDPGHGGRDPGAIGIGGLQEKHVVLPIAQEVAQILQQRGVRAVLTRNGDYFVSLAGRVKLAERSDATVFVSIHANAVGGGNSGVNGLETYYYATGYRLAVTLHRSLLRQVNVSDRGVRRARFYVLRETAMPAALIEVGYVTGSIDRGNLAKTNYRSQLAEAIANGILEYLR